MIRPKAHFRDYWRRHDANPRRPNPEAQRVARLYARAAGLPPLMRTPLVRHDPATCRAIAAHYQAARSSPAHPVVRAAYAQLVREVRAQYGYLPVRILFYGDGAPPPYTDSAQMMEDVRRNRRLYVYTGGEPHQLLPRRDNILFRAVHDYFGHAAGGFSFGPVGEENAWVEHSKMFTPLARAALTTETRGQNSWFTCGPHAHLPAPVRPYAVQKAIILPRRWLTHPVFAAAYAAYPLFVHGAVRPAANPRRRRHGVQRR